MRGSVPRTRWMALTLLLACLGAAIREAPPIQVEAEGKTSFGVSLVLYDAPASSAHPGSSTWGGLSGSAIDGTSGAPPRLARRPAIPPREPSSGLLLRPNATPHRIDLRQGGGASLLGLPTAPANAPPGL